MIAIVNYGMGNIYSVLKALEYIGSEAFVAEKPEDLERASRIILPGVGAFGAAMKNLEDSGLKKGLEEQVMVQKKPFLGICLGMQLLAEIGHEYGRRQGLGWFKGEVVKLNVEKQGLKIPHIGWNKVTVIKDNPLFEGIGPGSDFYFVHSYHLVPETKADLIAKVEYGQTISAAVWREHIFATQFHPEKSQDSGLRLLENFINWHG